METPASLAVGTSGRPLGTERSPALSLHATGELFEREVARASERAKGSEVQARHVNELESARRETRRSGFGRERTSPHEVRASEATLRPEHAPVSAQAAAQPALAQDEQPSPQQQPQEGHDPLAPASSEASAPAQASAPANEGASSLPLPSVGVPGAAPTPSAIPQAAAEASVAPASSAPAPEPVELAQMLRTSAPKAAKPAGAAAAANAPAAAVLERAAEILRQIELHATGDVKRLTLDLEPADLGRVSVQLALRAQRVTTIVRAQQPATLDALAQRKDELLAVLGRRGIAADSVRFELGFGGSRSGGYARARAASEAPPEQARVARAPSAPPSAIPHRVRSGRIDTYA